MSQTTTIKRMRIKTSGDLLDLRFPIPDSMINAAGLLKGKKINALQYQKQVRKGWEKRLKRQTKLALG